MHFAEGEATILCKKYRCKAASHQFYLRKQPWVEAVTVLQDGRQAGQ